MEESVVNSSSNGSIYGTGFGDAGLVQMLQRLKLRRKEQLEKRKQQRAAEVAEAAAETPLRQEIAGGSPPKRRRGFAAVSTSALSPPDCGGYDVDADTEAQILRQVEYYFGDYNLPKDKFMLDLIEESEGGWMTMDVLNTFKRLNKLSQGNKGLIMEILARNSSLMEVDFKREQVRRSPAFPVPKMSEQRRLDLQERTLFVAGFKSSDTTLDSLIDYFEPNYNGLKNIRMRFRRNFNQQEEDDERKFIGSCFFTFATVVDAENFIKYPVRFQGRDLVVKWQKDFFSQRIEFNDKFDPENVRRTVFVHGFDRTEIGQDKLEHFFGRYYGVMSVIRRCYRDPQEDNAWRFTGSVFVVFDTEERAEEFSHQKILFEGDRLQVKTQIKYFTDKKKFTAELRKLELC